MIEAGAGGRAVGPEQFQQQEHAIMGIGLDEVDTQHQAAGFLLPALEVIEVQEVPTDLRRGQVDLQRLQPSRLGLIETQ